MSRRAASTLQEFLPRSRGAEDETTKARLKPKAWIEGLIADLVLAAPENRLDDFGGQPIFNRPIVGIADGDDGLFKTFRRVVSPRHMMPRQILRLSFDMNTDFKDVRVISWALPFTAEIRRSNRGRIWPSVLYSVARNNGGALSYHLSRRLTEIIQKKRIPAVSPILLQKYDAFRDPKRIISSTWSERHVAFAAGLGRFGLNGSLITPAGSHVRLGSIVVGFPLEIARPNKNNYKSPCFKSKGEDCGICIKRCPVRAISAQGLDKQTCYERRQDIRERLLEEYARKYNLIPAPIAKSGKKYLGYSLGCALCQCSVPCEGTDPYLNEKK